MIARHNDVFLILMLLLCAIIFARVWLHEHPEHDPWAPLNIDDPEGWATERKIAALRSDRETCTDFLERSDIAFRELPALGEGACARPDRIAVSPQADWQARLRPAEPVATCPVQAGLALWLKQDVQPAAERLLGSRVARLDHFGTYACRRIGGGDTGNWSEHATGNAIDIAAFVLEDGRSVSVLRDWEGADAQAQFLEKVRDGACGRFATTLSPDYNTAHADHLHLDQASRMTGWTMCR